MARKTVGDAAKKTALEKALRAMFGRLQGRPVPDRLSSAIDQLEAADPPLKRSRGG